MAVSAYITNVGRSVGYAFPQIVKNRIPSVAALVSQFSQKEQRAEATQALQEIGNIIKEDVFDLLRKGLDNAKGELKTGKLYKTQAEQDAIDNAAFGGGMDFEASFDESMFDDADSGDGSSPSRPDSVAAGAAYGAAAGVQALAGSLGDSPAMRATAEASIANARFSRAGIAGSLAVGNMVRGAVLASTQVMSEIHRFQTQVQHSFYKDSLERQTASVGLLSSIVGKLDELREVSKGGVVAADQVAAVYSGRESDFSRVFENDGGFNLSAYIGVVAQRVKRMVGDESMFKQFATMVMAAPLTFALGEALESFFPKDFKAQMTQFGDFAKNLGLLVNERMRSKARTLAADGGLLSGAGAKVLDFLTIDTGRGSARPDLSNIVRGKAVAFDGYAHRSIVEVIPSYLADIHSELVQMRRATGAEAPSDRKLYDFGTGQFTSETRFRQSKEQSVERGSSYELDNVRRVLGDGGNAETAQSIHRSLQLLRDRNFSVGRGKTTDEFVEQLRAEATRLRSEKKVEDAGHLDASLDALRGAHERNGARFVAGLTAGLERARVAKARGYQDIAGQEGAARQIYSGRMLDPTTGREIGLEETVSSVGRVLGQPASTGLVDANGKPFARTSDASVGMADPVDATGKPLSPNADGKLILFPKKKKPEVFTTGEAKDYLRGSEGSAFRDEQGIVTLRSLLQSPIKLASKAMQGMETGISRALFGGVRGTLDKAEDGKSGLLGRFKDYLFGDTALNAAASVRDGGLFGRVASAFTGAKSSARDFFLGSGNGGERLGILTRVKSGFDRVSDRLGEYILGRKTETVGADGATTLTREGGLVESIRQRFVDAAERTKTYLFGERNDAGRLVGGLFGGVRTRFNAASESVASYLFGKKKLADDGFGNLLETGEREGGILGSLRAKLSSASASVERFIKNRILEPLSRSVFGAVGADGQRTGGLFGGAIQRGGDLVSQFAAGLKDRVMAPLGRAFFGEKYSIDNPDGTKTVLTRGGFFPQVWESIRSSIVAPLAGQLLGEKGPDGRKGGALGAIGAGIREAFAPLREAFLGEGGLWPTLRAGVVDTFRDLKKSLFGEGGKSIGDRLQETLQSVGRWIGDKMTPVTDAIKRAGDWVGERVVAPFGRFLNDPKTGVIPRLSRKMTATFDAIGTRLFGEKESFVDDFGNLVYTGKRKGGLFGSITAGVNRFFYGDPSKDLPGFVQRVVEPAKAFLKKEIWDPLVKTVSDTWREAKIFVRRELIRPLKGVFEPFVVEMKEQWRLLKEWTTGPLWDSIKGLGATIDGSIREAFGKGLGDMLRQNVLNPIKEALSSVRKFMMTALGGVLKLPVNILKGVSDELKISQIKRGLAGYLSPEERARLMEKGRLTAKDVPAGSGSSLKKDAEKPSDAAGEKKTGFWDRLRGKKDPSASDPAPAPARRDPSPADAADEKRRGLWERVFGPKAAATTAATGAPPVVSQSASSVAESAATAARAPGAPVAGSETPSQTPSVGKDATKDAAKPGVKQHSAEASMSQVANATRATADNTSNIYQFVSKHLHGVGKNVERIVSHFKIKDAALGGNSDEKRMPRGILGKLRQMVTNPIAFAGGLVSGLFDGLRKGVSKALSVATDILMLPVKAIGKGLRLLNNAVGLFREHFANILGALTDGILGAAKFILKGAGAVIREGALAVGAVAKGLAEAVPAVVGALGSAAVSLLKVGGTLALEVAKLAGSMTLTLVKVGATMVETAVKVTTDVVSTVATVTFGAIASLLKSVVGGGKNTTAALTPVFVTGGFLAGTTGGATTLAEAKGPASRRAAKMMAGAAVGSVTGVGAVVGAAAGFFSPEIAESVASGKKSIQSAMRQARDRLRLPFVMAGDALKRAARSPVTVARAAYDGVFNRKKAIEDSSGDAGEKPASSGGFREVTQRSVATAAASRETKWRDSLLSQTASSNKHLGGIRSGFSKFGASMMLALPAMAAGIGALVDFFKKGAFVKGLLNSVGRLSGTAGGETAVRTSAPSVAQPVTREPSVAAEKRRRGTIGKLADKAETVRDGIRESKVGRAVSGMGVAARVGVGAVGGMVGSAVGGVADGMEDGIGKRAVKTAGTALQFGAVGAMFGPVGMAAGAALGVVVENFDLIADGASWLWRKTKLVGNTIADASGVFGRAVASGAEALWRGVFGSDFEIDEKTGKVTRKETRNLVSALWEGVFGGDAKQLADGQIVKEGGLGFFGNLNNLAKNVEGVIGKMLLGEDLSLNDFVRGTVFEGAWVKLTGAFDSFVGALDSIGNGIRTGFEYISSGKFIGDIKDKMLSWWDSSEKDKSTDTRTWRQKLGGWLKSDSEVGRSEVKTAIVDTRGSVIEQATKPAAAPPPVVANRAFGGPLGKNGTLVGELGPEILDRKGNVISGASAGGRFQDPALVKSAVEREGSIGSTLSNSERNLYYVASQLASINAVLGGEPVGALPGGRRAAVFDPKHDAPAPNSGRVAAIDSEDNSVLNRMKAIGGSVVDGAKAIGGSVGAGAADIVRGAREGGISGAWNAAKSAVGNLASTVTGSAGAVVSAATDNLGAKGAVFKSLPSLGITDPKEQAMFMAQLDHESGGFRRTQENLNYRPAQLLKTFPGYFKSMEAAEAAAKGGPQTIAERVYGGRMGNRAEGDGFKFRGRGYIQLTGRDNYAAAGKALGIDLLTNPDLAAEHETATKIAAWYWKSRGVSKPAQAGDVVGATQLINGGQNGIEDRRGKFQQYMSAIRSGQLATAMTGGVLGSVPTLVGERQPEILTPDGRIVPSVDQFLSSPTADVAGLALSTAVKEAARRSAAGPDHEGATGAIAKAMSAAQALGGKSDELLAQVLAVLREIAGNTGKALEMAPVPTAAAAPVTTSTVTNNNGGNVFTMGGGGNSRISGMSPSMRSLLVG